MSLGNRVVHYQVLRAYAGVPLPPTQRYEYSTSGSWDAAYNFRRNSCTSNLGYGSVADFYAISTHPINMMRSRYKQYYYLYPKCGADVRLYNANANGTPYGSPLTGATIDKSLIPGLIDLDVPLVWVTGGQHYCWCFFALEEGGAMWLSMVRKGTTPRNFTSYNRAYHICKYGFNVIATYYPDFGYFENWILN